MSTSPATAPTATDGAPDSDFALTLQVALRGEDVPPRDTFERAIAAALAGQRTSAEVTLRLVERDESRTLNRRFRGIDKATNVLSFPASGLADVAPDFVGDIVICYPLVVSEARAQGKSRDAHLSHLVVHGVLHLLGFDHAAQPDAEIMENRERAILSVLGITDPYAE